MGNSMEWALEKELEVHTQEQRESLIAIDDALAFDPTNEELLLMKEELTASVKSAEHSLFQLKRARLLQEVDAMSQVRAEPDASPHMGSSQASHWASNADLDERDNEQQQMPSLTLGSKCRFRHINGRWYNGKVLMLEKPGVARISFLSPTTENMQICRFYLQQRCRFGGYCRQSHGMEVSLDALQPFIPTLWQDIPVGTTVLACDPDDAFGLWRPAELESLDDASKKAFVVFISDGKKADVGYDQLALSEHAESDTSETSSGDEEDEDINVADGHGLDIVSTGQQRETDTIAGQQIETVTFAKWEKHTRGIASKMMASMGFREGMGLGKSGQGQLAPIEVKILPSKQSLGYMEEKKRVGDVDRGSAMKGLTKKRSRGGKRKQAKKWAAAAFAAKVEQDKAPDVFGFINQQLAGQSDMETRGVPDRRENGAQSQGGHENSDNNRGRKEDRRTIVAHEDEMIEIRSKIGKLEEMAKRNRKEKVVYEGVTRKLQEARKALTEAETAYASATNAVENKEKEKKWLRF